MLHLMIFKLCILFRFTSAKKSVSSDGFMADGFLAIWTEVYKPNEVIQTDSNDVLSTALPPPGLYPAHNQSAIVYNPCLSIDATASAAQNAKNYFYCSVNNFCISRRLRCNDVNNCGQGDNSDEINCIKEIKVNLIELVGGLAGITLFGIFSFGIVFLTAFLIISSYTRTLSEIKQANVSKDSSVLGGIHYRDNRVGRAQLSGSEYSPYFASDLTTSTQRGTGAGGIIEVMTVSSTGGAPSIGQSKFKWPMASNSAETNVSDTLDHDFVDGDDLLSTGGTAGGNIPSSNTSVQTSLQIPPPPPPPVAGRAAMFNSSSRQSSLGGVGGTSGFCAFPAPSLPGPGGSGNPFLPQPAASMFSGSITSIDQSYPIYPSTSGQPGFHQGRSIGLSGAMSATLSRLPQTPSTTLASTFGYPYNTLSTHSSYGHGYGQIARAQQQFQPSAPLPMVSHIDTTPPPSSNLSNIAMHPNGNGTIDDTDDTELSLQINANEETNTSNADQDLNMMMMILDKSPEDDDLSDQETSLARKYQLRPAQNVAGSSTTAAVNAGLVQQQTLSSFASDSLLLEN